MTTKCLAWFRYLFGHHHNVLRFALIWDTSTCGSLSISLRTYISYSTSYSAHSYVRIYCVCFACIIRLCVYVWMCACMNDQVKWRCGCGATQRVIDRVQRTERVWNDNKEQPCIRTSQHDELEDCLSKLTDSECIELWLNTLLWISFWAGDETRIRITVKRKTST